MLTRINSLEKNINDLMELKNTLRELCKTYTSFNSWIEQAEERISEIEDQLNEIKQEGKIREKKEKKWTKPPRNMGLCEKTKSTFDWWTWMWQGQWTNCFGKHSSEYYPGKLPQPSKACQRSSSGSTENTTKTFLQKSNPKAHIMVRFTRIFESKCFNCIHLTWLVSWQMGCHLFEMH